MNDRAAHCVSWARLLEAVCGSTDVVTAAEWLPDGHRIATSSWDHSTVLWDVGDGTAQVIQLDQGAPTYQIRFICRANRSSCAFHLLWLHVAGHEQRVNNVVAHRSQPLLLSSARDGTFRLWDIRRASKYAVSVPAHSGYAMEMEWNAR